MIKLDKHPLTCRCDPCQQMFPPDRFEAVWSVPRPDVAHAERVTGAIPIGDPAAPLRAVLWIDEADRILHDWPGLPGTAGAHVEVRRPPLGGTAEITGTDDPILRGFTSDVPLRRRLAERFSARCLVSFGLAEPGTADLVPCAEHGEGLPALTCIHLVESEQPLEAVILYDVDGDYPDVFCVDCFQAYASGDLTITTDTCSRCQRRSVSRHHIVRSTWYGATPSN